MIHLIDDSEINFDYLMNNTCLIRIDECSECEKCHQIYYQEKISEELDHGIDKWIWICDDCKKNSLKCKRCHYEIYIEKDFLMINSNIIYCDNCTEFCDSCQKRHIVYEFGNCNYEDEDRKQYCEKDCQYCLYNDDDESNVICNKRICSDCGECSKCSNIFCLDHIQLCKCFNINCQKKYCQTCSSDLRCLKCDSIFCNKSDLIYVKNGVNICKNCIKDLYQKYYVK